jgi:hypothetical protein
MRQRTRGAEGEGGVPIFEFFQYISDASARQTVEALGVRGSPHDRISVRTYYNAAGGFSIIAAESNNM